MKTSQKYKMKTLIAAALIAVAGLIGIGISDAHAGGKQKYNVWEGDKDRYVAKHGSHRHHPKPDVTYHDDRSSERVGAAIAELLVFAVTGETRLFKTKSYEEVYVPSRRHWKHNKRHWKSHKKHARGRHHHGHRYAKTCFPVRKVIRGAYGNRRVVHGTACRDAYGNVSIVPGSRYIARYY